MYISMCKHALYSWRLWESNTCAGNWTLNNFTLLMKVNIRTNFPGNPSTNCLDISLDKWKMWPVGGAGWKVNGSSGIMFWAYLYWTSWKSIQWLEILLSVLWTDQQTPAIPEAMLLTWHQIHQCVSAHLLPLSCLLTWLNSAWKKSLKWS